MANRAVKQPNGLYARFSDVVDHFTHVHCTREELIEIYREYVGRLDAIGKLDRADASPERFEDEIETIRFVHGPLEADRTKVYLTEDPLSRCPIPPMLRGKDDPWDLQQEIADYERYILALTDTPIDPDERDFRERYRKELAKLRAHQAEVDKHMNLLATRIASSFSEDMEFPNDNFPQDEDEVLQ